MSNRASTHRNGFTLTEMMVAIVIIAILSSVTLYAMASVQTLAKEQRTKAQISKIHELIAERWQSYEELRPKLEYHGLVPGNNVAGQQKAFDRLNALRQTMKLEMPDRVSDVFSIAPVVAGVPGRLVAGTVNDNQGNNIQLSIPTPTLHRYYANFVSSRTSNWTTQHQGAECLYMILSRIEVGDMSAMEMFSEAEIGDTDNDGVPEILDAWGRPLNFLRWAPGFISPMQPGDVNGDLVVDAQDLIDSRDVFDYARVDPRTLDSDSGENWSQTYTLFPLIFSSGADGEANILRDVAAQETIGNQATIIYRDVAGMSNKYNPNWTGSGARAIRIPNDPYVFIADSNFPEPKQLGEVFDGNSQGHIDNIYNHLIETSTN